jgi:hypothetical protein
MWAAVIELGQSLPLCPSFLLNCDGASREYLETLVVSGCAPETAIRVSWRKDW